MSQPIGEIIEVTTTSFVAQCFETPRADEPRLYDPPPFGSFIKIETSSGASSAMPGDEPDPFAARDIDRDITFALVCHARTTSLTPGRRPVALGMADESEMRARQPQIFELLTTEFSGLLIGYTDTNGRVRRHLPRVPPRIHSRVSACEPHEINTLTRDLSFLRTVLSPGASSPCEAPPEQLAAACLREALDVQQNEDDFLLNAGRTLLILLGDDYDRLQAIMNSVLA